MKLHPVATALSVLLINGSIITPVSYVMAADYFDPALLSLSGGAGAVTDLSAFEKAGRILPGTYLVTVFINQSDRGLQQITFAANEEGTLTPSLTPALLDKLGVNTAALPSFSGLPSDKPVNNLSSLIPDANVVFDFQQQRLDLSVPQIAMRPDANSVMDPSLWDQGITAFLLNYSLSGGRSRQDSLSGPGSEQDNLFVGLNSGFNFDVWRLRSDISYARNEFKMGGVERQRYSSTHFSNTYLQRDIQSLRSDILVGENNTNADVFDSVPFRGVRLSSSEDMLPVSLRGFAPVISGIAQSNARVSVSQNGNIVYQTYVAPGPFKITDMYQTGQGGDLTVTVTEADGSVRTWRQAFSALPVMQRPGGIKYELTAGRYNGGITVGSLEAPFAMGSIIYGLPKDITLYGGGLIANNYSSAVMGSGISLGTLGALSADVTVSRAIIDNENQSGESYRVRYAKSLLSTGTSVDLTAYRYSTRHFYNFSDFNNSGYQLAEGQVPWALARERSDFQMRITQQVGEYGSIYMSGTRSDYWGNQSVNNTVSAGYNVSLGGVSYGLAYSIDRISSHGDWPQNRQFAFNMQVPLGLFSARPSLSSSYLRYQMSHNNQGAVTQQAGITGAAAGDRLSYSLMQGWDNNREQRNNNSTLNMGWQGSRGSANAGYSQGDKYKSLNLSGNGGLILHRGGLTFSPQLGSSVALISAPGAGGVSLVNGGTVTDSNGYAVAPYLSPYLNNTVSLNPTTLPDDVDLPQNSINIYPTRGAVVLAQFSPKVGYQVLFTIKRAGKLLPFGTVVVFKNQTDETNSGIVGDAGQVYMTGLPENGSLDVSWGAGPSKHCSVNFNLAQAQVSKNNPVRMLMSECVE
ncbi:TPA: fimbrial biogenesis outer membrane usher protein [Enterobacter bugandensis]|nr:fimbrial biogenesis outer membrane usher protein [Enterobacter bugandensis]